MFKWAKQLASIGLLGLNRRNAEYTLRFNPRHLYPLVDDKLRTKQLAEVTGITVPELYGVIEIERQIRDLPALLEQYSDFVIKPAHGSGGDGILIISGRSKEMYRTINGLFISQDELNYHISNVLSGLYSLGGQPDKALIEYRVKFDPLFEAISYQGVPDIRIIVFLGVPVMSMVRLPTRMSDGKANLHQGALGVGIDIATGTTLTAVWCNNIVTEHVDTGRSVTGVKIPNWDILLKLASRCFEITGLGYQGVDIVLDRDKGPMILEMNARPGLNIQIANCAGLWLRLNLVEQHHKDLNGVDERVAFAQKHFAA
jgi:alpha-L-glutamate ligase-like protein